MRRLIVLAAILGIVVFIAVSWLWVRSTDPAPAVIPTEPAVNPSESASPGPSAVDGLPVWTIGQATAARPTLDETEPIAVTGWYVQAPPHSCPAPSLPNGGIRRTSPVEIYCRRGEILLLERAETVTTVVHNGNMTSVSTRSPSGPYLDPAFLFYAIDQDLSPGGDSWAPHAITAVGHFADHTATACRPEDLQACLQTFAVDHVGAIGSEAIGATHATDPSSPHIQTYTAVESAVRTARGAHVTFLVVAGLDSGDEAVATSGASEPAGRPVWFVRVVDRGTDGTHPARLVTLLLDDATLSVRWSNAPPP